MTVKILDLFAGVSGLSLGFELFSDDFELHRAVEIDNYACQTLIHRYGEEKIIEGDLTNPELKTRVINECKGKVDIVVGGIPCQSFSLIGPRSGFGKNMKKFRNDKRDNFYREFRDIVFKLNPKIIVIENVKGILSKKDWEGNKIIDKIFSAFESRYNFVNEKTGQKYMLLNAADYGVPQKRERVIIIGINKKWKKTNVPYIEPTHYDPDSGEKECLLPYITLNDAIGDLPEVSPKITKTGLTRKQYEKIKKENEKVFSGKDKINISKTNDKHLTESGKKFIEFIKKDSPEHLHHHVSRSHQQTDIELYSLMNEGETATDFVKRCKNKAEKLIKYDMNSFKDKYRKQMSNKPCTTLFAHLSKDGNRFIHPFQARTITPREAARIQSFPDNFIFKGPFTKKFRQIGNAVPPLVSFNIAKQIRKIIND